MIVRRFVFGAALAAAVAGLGLPATGIAADKAAAGPVRVEPRSPSGVEKHLAGLHSRLGITAAQQPQWDAFANVMRDNVKSYDALAKARLDKQESMNAVEDMRSFQELVQAHADGLKQLTAAFQGLYDSMTPEQKQRADTLFHAQSRHTRHMGGKKKAT